MEIIFNLESKWIKLSIKSEIRIKTFYDMSALKKLCPYALFLKWKPKDLCYRKQAIQTGGN